MPDPGGWYDAHTMGSPSGTGFSLLAQRKNAIQKGLLGCARSVARATDPAVLPGTASFSIEEDWVDQVVDARWTNPLNDRWQRNLRGDIGDFGTSE